MCTGGGGGGGRSERALPPLLIYIFPLFNIYIYIFYFILFFIIFFFLFFFFSKLLVFDVFFEYNRFAGT